MTTIEFFDSPQGADKAVYTGEWQALFYIEPETQHLTLTFGGKEEKTYIWMPELKQWMQPGTRVGYRQLLIPASHD